MMRPANLRNRDHPATVRWLNIACDRRVSAGRQVRASVMAAVKVSGRDPSWVALVQDDAMIEALATDRTDESLDVRRLPWRTVCDHNFPDAHLLDAFTVAGPKTEHHPGGASHVIPLFLELLPYLREVFELAESGTEHVITGYRDSTQSLRTQLGRIIRKAGL